VKKPYAVNVKPTSSVLPSLEAQSKSTPNQNGVQVVLDALDLLEQVMQNQPATLSNLVKQKSRSLNQTFRLLATLESAGYVVRDTEKRYSLGAKLHLLGSKAPLYEHLIQVANPEMDRLSELSGEAVLLAVRVGLTRMVIAKREARHSLRVEWAIGSQLPLYVGGLGVALLAFSSREVQKAVRQQQRTAFTANTLTDPNALELELEMVRRERVRVSLDDYAVGEFAVAAPIVGTTLYGAINIAGFSARLSPEKLEQYREAVRQAADRIVLVLES
jgi:IclR family transcriptional regulator, KDG regulon repressor